MADRALRVAGTVRRVALLAGLVLLAALLTGFRVNSPKALIGVAEWYAANDEPELARQYFDWAIETAPRLADGYVHRAFFNLRGQRDREALADLTAALACDPKAADLYLSRGMLRERLGEPRQAYADYTAACGLGEQGGCDFAAGLRGTLPPGEVTP